MENRLARAWAHVDLDTVIRQPLACRDIGDELEHLLRLLGRKPGDVSECVDVALGDHEQVHRSLRVDVADRDEAVGRGDVIALAVELAEEAVVVHAARIPSSETAAPRTLVNSPTGADSATSHG